MHIDVFSRVALPVVCLGLAACAGGKAQRNSAGAPATASETEGPSADAEAIGAKTSARARTRHFSVPVPAGFEVRAHSDYVGLSADRLTIAVLDSETTPVKLTEIDDCRGFAIGLARGFLSAVFGKQLDLIPERTVPLSARAGTVSTCRVEAHVEGRGHMAVTSVPLRFDDRLASVVCLADTAHRPDDPSCDEVVAGVRRTRP